jgi:hypothetical protein
VGVWSSGPPAGQGLCSSAASARALLAAPRLACRTPPAHTCIDCTELEGMTVCSARPGTAVSAVRRSTAASSGWWCTVPPKRAAAPDPPRRSHARTCGEAGGLSPRHGGLPGGGGGGGGGLRAGRCSRRRAPVQLRPLPLQPPHGAHLPVLHTGQDDLAVWSNLHAVHRTAAVPRVQCGRRPRLRPRVPQQRLRSAATRSQRARRHVGPCLSEQPAARAAAWAQRQPHALARPSRWPPAGPRLAAGCAGHQEVRAAVEEREVVHARRAAARQRVCRRQHAQRLALQGAAWRARAWAGGSAAGPPLGCERSRG